MPFEFGFKFAFEFASFGNHTVTRNKQLHILYDYNLETKSRPTPAPFSTHHELVMNAAARIIGRPANHLKGKIKNGMKRNPSQGMHSLMRGTRSAHFIRTYCTQDIFRVLAQGRLSRSARMGLDI